MARKPLTRWQRLMAWKRSPDGQTMTHRSPALMVGAVAFYASYQHIYTVSTRYGQPADIAALMPIAIDALMIVAGRYVTHARSRLGRFYAVCGFILSSLASLAANIMAAHPDPVSRSIAAVPAVCLTIVALVVHYGERKPRVKRAAAPRRLPQAPVSPAVTATRPVTLTDVARVPLPWDAR